jgi:hypothetical protein
MHQPVHHFYGWAFVHRTSLCFEDLGEHSLLPEHQGREIIAEAESNAGTKEGEEDPKHTNVLLHYSFGHVPYH